MPGETLTEREDEDAYALPLVAQGEGHLLTFPGRATDPKAVATKIAELHGIFHIRQLAFDRWRIEDIKRELDAIGCGVELAPFGQGYKDLSAPPLTRSNVWSSRVSCRRRRSPRAKNSGGQLRGVRNGQRRKSKIVEAQINGPYRSYCRDLYGDRHRGTAGAGY